MSAPVTFQQVLATDGLGTPLYEVVVPGSVGWAGYLVMNKQATLPPSIGAGEALNGDFDGAYLFYRTRPVVLDSDPAAFADAATQYVNKYAPQNRALFWLQSEADPFGAFDAFGFVFSQNQYGQWQITSNLNANLGTNLILNIQTTLFIAVDADSAQLTFSYAGSQNPLISLQVGSALIAAPSPVSACVPASGPSTGCVVFQAAIKPATALAGPPNGVSQGVQFAYTASDGALRQLFLPAFNTGSWPATITVIATIDPSDPLNNGIPAADLEAGYLRTGLVLSGSTPLASYYLTPQGNAISLTPLGSTAGGSTPVPQAGALALQSASQATTPIGAATVYFAPAGSFGVSGAGTDDGELLSIMGGLFGSERLTLTSYNSGGPNDVLCFVPSQPAYAPVFPFENANLEKTGSGSLSPRLTADYQTPWTTVLAGAAPGVVYQAEPEGSALYGLPAGTTAGGPPILLPTPPGTPVSGSTQNTFPLAPYGNAPVASATADTLTQYESQIIEPTRKLVMESSASAAYTARAGARQRRLGTGLEDASDQYSTSPQGFLVASDPASGAYHNVQLAQSTDTVSGNETPFAFTAPTQQLETALRTNQLFMVAVDSTNLGPFENLAWVAGWKLQAQVGKRVTATSYRNVMILKFCSGTLQERAGNPNQWTSAPDFSLAAGTDQTNSSAVDTAYAGLAQWLTAYIQDGIDKADSGPSVAFYENFKNIVTDPDWNGVMVLEADLAVDDLPPEIAGLAAGIDLTKFTAHHFGFTVSRVAADPAWYPPLQMQGDSSFFGLIDYENSAYATNMQYGVDPDIPVPIAFSGDFQFTVLLLQVLFENSKIANFRSNVQLSVASLLGSRVLQTVGNSVPGATPGTPMPANAIVLNGSYVAQSGAGSTADSYVFQQTNTTVFRLDSNVLQAVAFSSVQFSTLSTDDGSGNTTSRFLIWGAFDFTSLISQSVLSFDVLSFGSATGTSTLQLGSGLAFSNFVLDLSSPNATPNVQTFQMSLSDLAYDLNASSPRAGSLFLGFGPQLKSFVTAGANQTPANAGFLAVDSDLDLAMLTAPWYGVVYRMTLGGPGALASAAGFDSDLLLAWSPSSVAGDTEAAVFLGLSLPGAAPGAKQFSLEGVFQISTGSITLIRQEIEGGGGAGFCMRLDDVGVKIFGIAKLPPDATIQFFLFGDPNSTGSLGWYAAYVDESTSAESQEK